ncbi:MAG: tRNA (5-methylaminomethyl-2-thiouridine)(34)-methyltransferase MnmD [Fodinibius sp.]|nr:tRNA (5-methylaminomethyl-2-thiouridine)(34)-methyltransferase MnmD [Fodinibius sp.]
MPDPSSEDSDSKLIVTQDGSHTVYSSQFDQHYHNPNGAIAESRYVFFEQSQLLENLSTHDQINILEIGFGTGLNLLVLLDYYLQKQSNAQIDYYSVEGFPLSPQTAQQFNYNEQLRYPDQAPRIPAILDSLSKGMNHFEITEQVTAHIFYGMFKDFVPGDIDADYLFHDAFSPSANPELWTGETFTRLKDISAENAVLTTYSAASKAQGALAAAGWKVAKTKGALGKREMIVASPDANRLSNFSRINEKRYARRYAEGDFD